MLNYLSVCSGIEAATAAWHPLGWTPVAFSEIEAFPSAVLGYHYPLVPNWGDMTKYPEWPDARIDVLVGGTPCQAFSIAGLRKGLADPRGNLALVYLGIADRYRPEWIVWENVPGVLSSNGGRDFGSFLGALAELGYGYAYRVLDAQFFGVAQRRRRVFVVANATDWRRAAAVLFEPDSVRGNPPPRREARQDAAAGTPIRTGGGGGLLVAASNAEGATGLPFLTCSNIGKTVNNQTPLMVFAEASPSVEIAPTLRAGGNKTGGDRPPETDVDTCASLIPVAFAQNSRDEVRLFGGDGSTVGALAAEPGAKQTCYLAFSCKDHGADAGELAPTLRAMGHGASHANAGGQVAVAFQSSQSGVRVGEAHATLDSNNGSRRHNGVIQASAVRRLTPRECERLQGFPDDWTLIPVRGKPAADGPRYKALGNSMAVPVMRWIGERIAAVDAICKLL